VEALESGDYARLPGPVFVRGFIRNYARLLKIDPSPLLEEIAAHSAPAVVVVPEKSQDGGIPFPGQRSWNWRPYAIGALVVVAALVGYEFYGEDLQQAGGETNAVTVELPAPKLVAETRPDVAAAPEPSSATAAGVQPVPARSDTAAPPARTEVRSPAVEPGPDDRVVRMMFSRDSWVEVRDRQGRVLLSQLNLAGTAQAVSGQPPLRLVVGNAGGVRLMYNDRLVDLAPHTQVDVARLTLE
jgi:cytoskeleton protein RodZ